MSLMPKLLEINDELVRVREERDRLREERDQAVENAARLHAELYATRKQLQDVCSAKPAEPQQHPAEYTPPEGWRVLQYGELLQPGDHWVNWDGTVSRPDIQHGDGATVSGGRYIRWVKPQPQQPKPEPEFKPYTFAAYIVGDKSQPDALRIVWATEEWIQHSQFGIVHRMRDMHLFDNDGGCNITEYHETLTLSLEVR